MITAHEYVVEEDVSTTVQYALPKKNLTAALNLLVCSLDLVFVEQLKNLIFSY